MKCLSGGTVAEHSRNIRGTFFGAGTGEPSRRS